MSDKIAKPGSPTDVMTAEQRSRCMSRIKGKNTGPELLLRKALWEKGWRYRIKNSLPGRPDVVFAAKGLAIFIDGCFWHGCPLHGTQPKSNNAFWRKKLSGNIERDKKVTEQLKDQGWKVIRLWEHEVKSDLQAAVNRVEEELYKTNPISQAKF